MNSPKREHRTDFASTIVQSLSFGMIGVTNTLVDLAVFVLLVRYFHWHIIPAQVVSYSCGLVNSYILNRVVTFRQNGRPPLAEMIRFVGLNGISGSASVAVLAILQHVLSAVLLSKLLTTVITLVLNFTGSKLWVFRNCSKAKRACQGT